ncbi:SRPBCC domain-containing protein [Bacillus sp. ISL-35]|uniref:SRPBCC family protein n=1 Tax=Bacillus sp. ISL-35 TaxID=2819122 RepID=UPI001BE9E26F|nr:SRPBCC domain-containing protein [Bacillus sp. ISL-35]MBT2679382.1 SRPBCC domain-containing protein [Bacillus sp. ISL-35]MBT2703282.1 SRPBCC domain-containing protein [Chryseobacterium sp. ISL-80]
MEKSLVNVNNEITVNLSIELVWHAWTISDRAAQWFAPDTNIGSKVGGPYELYFVPGNKSGMNTKGCKILKLDHCKELVFEWKGPDQFNSLMNKAYPLTKVTVNFEKVRDDTTKVIVLHTGFKEGDAWNEAIQWHEMAWSGVLKSLKSALETGEGELCCQPE